MSVDRLIMVIDGQGARGQNLKELLEFMDAPRVQIASPEDWRKRLGDRRLAAIFMGDDLPQEQFDRLLSDIAEVDPTAPIVLVSAGPEGAFDSA
jgi:DNA-binding NtrC family response regulator